MLIKQDKIDRHIYEDALEHDGVKQVGASAEKKEVPWIAPDLWSAIFKADPQFTDRQGGLKPLLEEAMATKEFQAMRSMTMLNELNSSIALSTFGREFVENIPEHALEREKLEEQKSGLESGKAGLDAEDPLNAQVDAELERISSELEKLPETTEEDGQAVRVAVRQACEQAAEQAEQMQGVLGAWGKGPGSPAAVDGKTAALLANKLSGKAFQKFLEMVGRALRAASAIQSSKLEKVPHELCGIELGKNPLKALPQELALLNHPKFKLSFYRKASEGALLSRKMKGNEKSKKGPIVVALDESGSMADCIAIAKAIAVACFWVAKKQKRGFALVRFSSQAKTVEKLEPKDLPALLSEFMSGGTEFLPAFREIVRVIEKEKGKKNADVVFISDGGCYDSRATSFIKRKKAKLGFRVFSLGIGISSGSAGSLPEFSDKINYLNSLTMQSGEEIFKFI